MPQVEAQESTPSDIEVDATSLGQAQAPQGDRPSLRPSNSTVKRDAARYGVNWKPAREFTFWTPKQVKDRHRKWLKLLGRIGWTAKGIIYALIGGLACKNAVGEESNASPQGAFVLIGTANGGRGALVVLAVAIATYSCWRFWEGAVGQGYDDTFSKAKNFFKFRLSPVVSGGVYVAYMVLVVEVIPRDDQSQHEFADNDSWPNNWHDSGIGKAGLILVGVGFLAGTIVQIEQFLTKSFHNTIKDEFWRMPKRLWRPFRIFVLTTGHLGVLGRGGIFLFAAILFFRTVRAKNDYNQSAFGAAFAQLQSSRAGNAALFIMGFLVVVYGLFAVLNVYARIFPTPPPSRHPKRRHFSESGGEAPLTPQFAPGTSGFHPMRGPSTRNLALDNTAVGATAAAPTAPKGFSPLTDAVAKSRGKIVPGGVPSIPENSDIEMGARTAPHS